MESLERRHAVAPQAKKRVRTPKIIASIAIVVVVLVAFFTSIILLSSTGVGSKIDSSKYQAVFLTNGQVYFGKLESIGGGYLHLKDVYYLQSGTADSANPQNADKNSGNPDLQLIKLGQEIHGPEDQMVVNKDEVLFFENLKADGTVSQSIQRSKS